MADMNYMGLDGFVWFMGVVEDRNDPEQLGRVRVRCLGFNSPNLSSIPTSDLPWAHVMHPTTDPSMHGMGKTPSFLVEGGWVVGFFRDVDKQQPVIIGTLPGVPETQGGIESAYNSGFNDPRHKNSNQVNSVGKKQYAKEDDDGKTWNAGEASGPITKDGVNYDPKYGDKSYGPYPLGGFVNGIDDEDGVFSRASGHSFGESDTNRLAKGSGHGMLSAKDSAYTKWVLIPHSDQKLDEENPMHKGYGVDPAEDEYVNGGIDIYGNKELLDEAPLDSASSYSTMAGKSDGPNVAPRQSSAPNPIFILENSDINDRESHPHPAAGAPQTVDASHTADAINPLYYSGQDEYTAEKWNEPRTTDKTKGGTTRYAAKYPYNHVFESESGHIKEYDDTPGSERIHEWHRTGTFYEIDADGTKHTRVVGNNYEVIHGTDFVNIKGDVNLTIESNCKTYIKGDWNIQVDGNKYETVKGNVHETYGTTLDSHHHVTLVHGEREETVTKNVIQTYGTTRDKHFHTRLVTGSTNDTVLRNVTETYGTLTSHGRSTTISGTDTKSTGLSTNLTTGTSYNVTTGTSWNLTTGTSWNYTVGTAWDGTTGTTWDHESTGIVTIEGEKIELNP